jgi:hypothetical protein
MKKRLGTMATVPPRSYATTLAGNPGVMISLVFS